MNETEAEILRQLMEEVVESGTGTRLKEAAYTAAGKTGSAEFGTVKGESHAWFTGYAPADDPQVCVTIMIEGAGAGGDYAVPVAKRIFDEYFSDTP
jgi:peptidoglycan glycosyltransferase